MPLTPSQKSMRRKSKRNVNARQQVMPDGELIDDQLRKKDLKGLEAVNLQKQPKTNL